MMKVQAGKVKSFSAPHGTAPRLKGNVIGRSGIQTKGNAIVVMTVAIVWIKDLEMLITRDLSVPRGSHLVRPDSLVPGLSLPAL